MDRSKLLLVSLVALSLGACASDRGDAGAIEDTWFGSDGSEDPSGDRSGSEGSEDDSGSDDPETKYDVGTASDLPGGCGGEGLPEFSYIWVANTSEGTISRLNTETMVEEGRYMVRPDGDGSPSRTSVSLSGDVAVASRMGGVTKIYARSEACQDTNGTAGIQTSTGINDVLAWGQEECVAWHTPLSYDTQRAVAWAPGDWNEATCSYTNEKLWTSGANNGGQIEVLRLHGQTGAVEDQVAIPEVWVDAFGAYGGAVNADGDFWIMTYAKPPQLVRVDADDLTYDIINGPNIASYGFTVDSKGRPWIGGFVNGSARYDPDTDTWDVLDDVLGYGIQEDADGNMWMATFAPEGVRAIDSETFALGPEVSLPGIGCKGVSIDFYGHVWVVDMANSAYRVNAETLQYDAYNQLNSPYTYSDMTGWGLSNVTFPPSG